MKDILFQEDHAVFSYRIAGICIQNGLILLQKPKDSDYYAFVGGHAAFGETNEETLIREFLEETGAQISVGPLKWVSEVFFSWGEKPCHQICLYYLVTIADEHTPLTGTFPSREPSADGVAGIDFHWIPLEKLDTIRLYPQNAPQLLAHLHQGVQHFVDRE